MCVFTEESARRMQRPWLEEEKTVDQVAVSQQEDRIAVFGADGSVVGHCKSYEISTLCELLNISLGTVVHLKGPVIRYARVENE